jgi:hypothetical protein
MDVRSERNRVSVKRRARAQRSGTDPSQPISFLGRFVSLGRSGKYKQPVAKYSLVTAGLPLNILQTWSRRLE